MCNTNLNEQGRSMVEMLGVLAIIGVLTIIGITGFRYALNKHYANQTVERLMRRAVVLAGQANFGQNPSLHEFDENDGEYPISRTLKSTSESFTMRVDNVPQEVCQQIVGMEWKLAKIIPENCSDETMEFMFLNDLTDCTDCQPETFPCEDYGTECGKCSVVKGFARDDTACANSEKPYCNMGECSKCEPGYFVNIDNGCTACGQQAQANSDQANRCLGQNVFGHIGNWQMLPCDYSGLNIWNSDGTTCKACKNRCYNPNDKLCHLAGSGAYDRGGNGECICRDGYFLNTSGTCTVCGQQAPANSDQAMRCLGKNVFGHTGNWQMLSCDDSGFTIWNSDGTTCKACEDSEGNKNRCYNPNDKLCYLAGSGAYDRDGNGECICRDGYYQETNGKCLSCSEINATQLTNPQDCYQCQDGEGHATHYLWYTTQNTFCSPCSDTSETHWSTIPQCSRCSNRCLKQNTGMCLLMGSTYDKDANGYCVSK